jgi:hypothetical protein
VQSWDTWSSKISATGGAAVARSYVRRRSTTHPGRSVAVARFVEIDETRQRPTLIVCVIVALLGIFGLIHGL